MTSYDSLKKKMIEKTKKSKRPAGLLNLAEALVLRQQNRLDTLVATIALLRKPARHRYEKKEDNNPFVS